LSNVANPLNINANVVKFLGEKAVLEVGDKDTRLVISGVCGVCCNEDPEIIDVLSSQLVALGTDYLLKKQTKSAFMAASIALTVIFLESTKTCHLMGPVGLRVARDLVSDISRETTRFFLKRNSCNCLKESYSKLRSQTKLGMCACCSKVLDRKILRLCGECKVPQYCSESCQTSHWSEYREVCKQMNMLSG